MASAVLVMILLISILAVIATILVPLRDAARACPLPLAVAGSLYFSLIGMGFMLAEIALLQRFSIYLGHPIYSLSVCLFSLILASGLGSMTSDRLRLDSRGKLQMWAILVVAYLVAMGQILPVIFQHTTGQDRLVRIVISVAAIMPLGFLLGFAFPTGMRLVEAVDRQPTPWFWGINGATGVLASVLGVMFSMALGIRVTMLLSALCYLLLIPAAFALLRMRQRSASSVAVAELDGELSGVQKIPKQLIFNACDVFCNLGVFGLFHPSENCSNVRRGPITPTTKMIGRTSLLSVCIRCCRSSLRAVNFGLSGASLMLIEVFWKPMKTSPISSAGPKSTRASEMELWYLRRNKGVSFS